MKTQKMLKKFMAFAAVLLLCIQLICPLAVDTHSPDYAISLAERPRYLDVKETDWYYDAVEFAAQNGLMDARGNGLFAPLEGITRGELVMALGRFCKVDTAEYTQIMFTDIPQNSVFAPYIAWANANNIVSGYGNGIFAPNDVLTREQMCVIIINFIDYMELTLEKVSDIQFTDSVQIHSWASEQVMRMASAGLVSGINGAFQPQAHAGRAQAAVLLKNISELCTPEKDKEEG